jgi:amino acid adenylation domain-containing protein
MGMAEHGSDPDATTGLELAVVGMAARFPGADDVHAFWRNLRAGVESISFYSREQLLEAGTDPALLDDPRFVPARGELRAADELDAGLFGLTPRDAEILDPQHRVLLECAWAALEHAGVDPARMRRPVGVFAGTGTNRYGVHLEAIPDLVGAVGQFRITLANEKDHVSAGIAYRLDLRGPAMAVQTACSTSLVAVHVACQSLINGECDLALAGGACVGVPPRRGYLYSPDGILSPDGHCRAFDADARGTVGGNGAGMVALKRLDDAVADGDTIHAVIRGSAVNNDGGQKVGYTAPSITGQARVISEALSVARVDASTLHYVETHGSGTPLGDAIELKALGQVLAGGGEPCAIGSVKTNVGHLDAAAGVAGLIKTVLALRHAEIPPSLHCAAPHAEIAASGGRVFVNTALRPWTRNGTPRRAGVSSFGIGGTNAHVVLEEAPPRAPSGPSRALQLLVLSARTPSALRAAAEGVADHLEGTDAPLADAAHTLQTGRRELEHRLAVVCRDAAEGAARLREAAARAVLPVPRTDRPVAFLFPGLGMQHVDMGRGLYDAEPVFRDAVDECCELLLPVLGSDLRARLYAAASPAAGPAAGGWDLRALLGKADAAREASPLDDTRFAQPAVFVTEYALAKLWMSWGVRPRGLAGHSLGEYVAACVAGVLRLQDALTLVALRAKLIDALPEGAMLAVPLGEAALRAILPAGLDLAAVNTAESCVVSGSAEEVAAFEALLAERGTVHRRLATRHAFHSRAMQPLAAELERLVAGFALGAPEIPFVSNVTGTWISDEEACSPAYWARHLCGTVRFADGVATLREEPGWALLEVGPGQTLGAWAMQHPAGGAPEHTAVLSSLRHPHNRVPDLRFLLETLGGLWAAGVEVDWGAFSGGERRHRVPLPGYPFERKRHWVDPPRPAPAPVRTAAAAAPDAEPVPEQKGPYAMENRLRAQTVEAAPSPRYHAVLNRLKGIASELTGIQAEHVGTDTDLFQAGFDSLLLLQAIQVIEKKLGVRLSLVEMLEEMSTLGAVARHIDAVLPAGAPLHAGNGHAQADAHANGHGNGKSHGNGNGGHDDGNGNGTSHGNGGGAHVPALAPLAVAAPAAETAAPPAFSPAPVVPAPPAFHPAPAVRASAPVAGSMLERVVAEQFHFMAQQSAQQLQLMAQQSAQQLQLMAQQIAACQGVPAAVLLHAPEAQPTPAAALVPAPAAAPAADPSPAAAAPAPRAKIQPETFVPYQPLNPEGQGGLTPAQAAYLQEFMARYVARTRASKAHQAQYHVALADTRVTARFRRAWKEIIYPIVSQRALGSRVWDLDGNEYVDTGMAFGCSLFGHAPEFVSRAIRDQVERGYGVGPQSPDAGRAAALVCELGGNDRAVFCNSGTEAVMGAIRAARTFTGRGKIAYFAGSYHGWSDAVLGRLMTPDGRREVRPMGPGVPARPLDDVLMLEWDRPASLELLAEHLHEIALVMVEPVQSRRPDLQPRAFLHELRRMTREAGALLLFDELITGFRMGAGGAQAFYGVDADLVTYGKIVAGGLPMGVVAGKHEVMSVFDGGVWSYGDDSFPTAQRTIFAGAYFKHPLSMAVACSILEEVRRQGAPLYEALNARTAGLVERINAFFEAGGFPITAAHFASCFRFFFGPEVKCPDLFSHHLILEGVHVIPETGTHFLSTAHSDADVERIFEAVRASAEAMRRGGFIPGPAGGPPVPPGSGPAPDLDPPPPPAPEARGPRSVPLTEGQRQLWLESQMGDEANCAYIESTSVRLHGALDVEAMCRAAQALVDRHDTLRTTFGVDGDEALVHAALAVEVPVADFRGAPAGEREARVEAWVRGSVRRPFDLAAGPLVRFALARVDHDEHLLLFTVHHAVLDGWSFGVVLKELGVLYDAAREGRPAALPPRPDHAALVRTQAAALREDPAADAFWRERFADGVPVLELPTDRPRPPVRSYRGERTVHVVRGHVVRPLVAATRPHGLTLFNTVLSAAFVWLGRLSGDDDLVIGTPSASQAGRSEAADLVGYGINILPIRARVDGSASFVEHARRVRRSLLGALEHQDFSFPRLVETLLRGRDASRPPVFSVLLNLDRAPEDASLGNLRAAYAPNFAGGAKVDLTLDVSEVRDALHVRCVYATDLFDAGTIGRWLAAFERLLAEVARDPAAPLAALTLIGDAERRMVVEEWNRTERAHPHLCIHQLFEEQVRRTPGAVAVVAGGEALTYAELDAAANQVARFLRRRGIGPEDRVALCLERRPELMTAFFGILKAGAAYVPLEPTHPAERLGYMLRDSGARLLLTQSWLEARLPAERPETLCLDALAGEIADEPTEGVESGVTPENLAYVYYTSGSTGRPKGVAMHHHGPANYFAWGREAYRAAGGGGAPVFSSMAVDLTLASFIPLFAGERVVLLPEGPGVEPLADAIRRGPGFGMIKITPTHLALLNQVLSAAEAAASTATLVIGADNLVAEPTRLWQEHAPGVRLLNEYGPTETVVGCSLYELPRGRHAGGRIPIGRPIDNLTLYVLDEALRPVPVGLPGELYVGGVGVARGYLGRPALTAEKFVPDPFAARPGARLYRTGDRARFLADGNAEFLGRTDFQVKVRGYRIETGEVESVLAAHPGVGHALVVVREDVPGDPRLVAYVVADPGAAPADALREALRRAVPEYMVPSAFVFLDALPVGPTGKVQRKALPAPDYAVPAERYVAPRTPLEAAVAEIWAGVLGVERVGVRENFFELGGHSLLATRLVSRLRQAFSVELPLRTLMEGQTVAELAARVDALRAEAQPQAAALVPVERTRALPLSFAQERLWFLDRLQPGSDFYNIPVARRLAGPLDAAALERALGELVRRHEPLRTTFREVDDAPVQVVAPAEGFSLPRVDLAHLDPAEREAEVRRRATADAARPFDLAAGPLFRATLLRLADDDHVLLLGLHHIVFDGWSQGVLLRELAALYEAYRDGGESPLADLPVQYADYAVWQRERLAGDLLERQLAYWRGQLAGAPALLELPTDRPRPAVQTFRGGYARLELSDALLEGLQALARREGATLYMVLLAAFQVLLGKHCGTDDVVVGSPVAGRNRAEVEGLVGFFVNTLVLRTDLSGDPSFREALRRVKAVTLGAFEHQEVPFERLVEELQPQRSLSHSPLFQVMFSMDDLPRADESLAGVRMEGVPTEFAGVKFDLTLSLGTRAGGVFGSLLYTTDLFDPATVERMAGQLERVLAQAAADADARLSRLVLADAAERARVVEAWNRTDRPFPREACLHDLFEAQVRECPGAPALAWGEERLTYLELDTRANRLAHHLVGLGVGPEARVGLLLERGVEMVAATLAVMKAGGCCVPVDTSYPRERVGLMLADAGARVLLSRSELCGALGDVGAPVVRLDEAAAALAGGPATPPRSGAAPGNLAYLFYTSGSTGRPKGVMMAHRQVVQYAAGLRACMPMGPGDRVAQASNASFDAAVFEIWGALLHGAALVGIDRDVLLSAPALGRTLREQGITHLYQTAALFSQHVRERVDVYAGLKQLVFGAEAVGTEGVRRMLRAGKPERVLHEYGPTEATVWCTLEPVEEVAEDAATVSIGRPIPNARAYVLDPALEALPPGVPGELHVGGEGVVRGYLGRPALTAEKFVPDPFAAEPGARMYRTGDRVRWGGDGKLEFMGRLDHQVKIRGFRIEPGEVESALSAHPGVREARVVVREDRPGDKQLVAYVVGEVEAHALRAGLRQSLPEYMVPRGFVVLDRLPLTPNGKLDRAALPAPRYAADGESVAPRTPAEGVLAGIWAEVLGRETVGVTENFFELGGHSLLAMRVVSRIRAAFGVEVPVRTLFQGPTVAELAAEVGELRLAEPPALLPVLAVQRGEALPLSFAQERLWFLDRLQQGGSYAIPAALRLAGRLDAVALERALGAVVRRHEPLRTTFREVDGVPVQRVAPFAGFALPVDDLSALGEAEREAGALRLAEAHAAEPFDLTAGPLFRARLLRLAAEEHVLLLSLHHIVSDGWSMRVLYRELWALYAGEREGREETLPELPVQYADYAVWQREQSDGEAGARQLAYWKARLAGAPELLELPTDHPRPPVPSFRGADVPVTIPLRVLERLRELGRGESATLYMVVLAAFQLLLSRYAASDDVVVGTPVAGRTRHEVEELVGLFTNTLVLRTDLSGDPSFRELVRRVRETVLGGYEHQDVPFERLVGELHPERSLSHSTLFQVLFQLDEAQAPIPAPGGLRVKGLAPARGTTKFDLTLVLNAHARGITGVLEYGTDLFRRGTARRMVEHLERVLEQAAADPDRRLSRLELMGRAERARVVGWNRTTAKYPAELCIHQLFEAQAAKTPDAPAVRFGDAALTYRELDERANRLARHLAGRGVGPEVRVGICLERGLEAMVAMLGVMKAGGAYVPLDPGFPVERAAYMLDDSRVAVLLTQERLRGRLPARDGLEVLSLDLEWDRIATESAEPVASGVASENLAYVIYTSGSTGRPKGVAMHHRGVCNYLHWGVRAYGADQGAGAPVFTSLAVDLTVTNLLPLFAGFPVRFLPEESPVEALAATLRERPGFGLIKITPIHLGLLNSLLEPGELAGAAYTLVVGADFLSAEPTVPWQEHAPGVRLMNEYGPTETVVGCSAYVLPPGRHRAGPVPVGHPIQNLRFHVLDAHLRPVPVGLPGELYIGGAGVARGYLGRPGLTAEKFVPDPFAEAGARMYRTGDRARWQADGNLMILGRTDNQVKLRGYRVELGEIEAVLRRGAGVRECMVVVREDHPGDRRLVAYVVADPAAVDPAALREQLRGTLPEYMVPAAFVVLEALPQTPTGKIDRKALPAPEYLRPGPELDEPANYEEAQLIQMWEDVLEVDGIGPTQSFFELGGDSFLALRLFAQVNRRLGCDLPVATLFAGATVRHMADAIREQKRSAPAPSDPVVPLQPAGSLPPLFVIHSTDRSVMGYVNLVRHLGADQPVFGLRDVGEELSRPLDRIAAEHVAAIRSVQPQGPYYLLGWSFGGFLAYEMALQLESQGERAGFVGLMDTMSTDLAQAWPWMRDEDLPGILAEETAARMRRPFALRPEELQGLGADARIRRIVEALHAQGAAPADFDAAVLARQCQEIRDRAKSYAGYAPGGFSGTLTLFRAGEWSERHEEFFAPLGEEEQRTLGWSRHALGPMEIYPVPGSHVTIGAEPHVQTLARHLREALAAAHARAGAAEAASGRFAPSAG